MAHTFMVRPHPLGVVVYERPEVRGELLLPGEECCGVPYEELVQLAATGGRVEIADAAAKNCLLKRR